jgi:hypothetical protein
LHRSTEGCDQVKARMCGFDFVLRTKGTFWRIFLSVGFQILFWKILDQKVLEFFYLVLF